MGGCIEFSLLTLWPWVWILALDYTNVAELINWSTLLRVRVDSGMSKIVDRTHPVWASGKLILQKNYIMKYIGPVYYNDSLFEWTSFTSNCQKWIYASKNKSQIFSSEYCETSTDQKLELWGLQDFSKMTFSAEMFSKNWNRLERVDLGQSSNKYKNSKNVFSSFFFRNDSFVCRGWKSSWVWKTIWLFLTSIEIFCHLFEGTKRTFGSNLKTNWIKMFIYVAIFVD